MLVVEGEDKRNQKLINMKKVSSFFILMVAFEMWANHVVISNVTRTGANRDEVEFRISWENSWYYTSGKPGNHDAVWVFIKFRLCDAGGQWSHALLSTNMSDHFFDDSITYAKPILTTDRFGNPGQHNTGVLIRRKNVGRGHIVNQLVRLKIVGSTSGVPLVGSLEYDIKVFGIEMVQIPAGPFYVGDGVSGNTLHKYGTGYNTPYGYLPYKFTAELSTDSLRYGYYDYWVKLNSTFPKGYNEFYIMKYEITQGQYVDFLNTLDPSQALNRAYVYNYYGYYGYGIELNGTYTTPYPNRAMGYMTFNDLLSYLDWACLRPMTELEYEKACRGPKVFVPGEFAWGNTNVVEAIHIATPAGPGTDTCTDVGANLNFYGSDSYIRGGSYGGSTYGALLEVGIFARDHTLTREATGGSYYGVMELSGNAWERCVQVNENQNNPATASSYTGIWGDGILSSMGLYNEPTWPVGKYFLFRGGTFAVDIDRCRVSARYDRNYTDYNSRNIDWGGRGVR